MPHFSLETNIPKNKITAEFLKQTTALMAKTLGKPESVSKIFDYDRLWRCFMPVSHFWDRKSSHVLGQMNDK